MTETTEQQQQDDEENGGSSRVGGVPPPGETTTTTTTTTAPSCCRKILTYDRDSTIFSMRVGTSLVIGSLFTLAINWPNGIWLYVTLAIVSWQPALDVASCAKKSVDRIVGTILGSVAGLVVGFLSLLVPREPAWRQAVFLGVAGGIIGYVYPYVAFRLKKTAYPFALATWTFGISFLAFYDTQTATDDGTSGPDPWEKGLWRMINIIMACVIGTVLPLFIWPISTQSTIVKKMNIQMKNTGKFAKLILQATHELLAVGKSPLLPIEELIANHEDSAGHGKQKQQPNNNEGNTTMISMNEDQAHVAYMATGQKWADIYGMFKRLKYDILFHHCHSKADNIQFEKFRKVQMARLFRINSTIIMLDSFVRAGLHHDFVSPEDKTAVLRALLDAGQRIECVLDMTIPKADRDTAAQHLIGTDLRVVQNYIQQYRKTMVARSSSSGEQQAVDKEFVVDDNDPLHTSTTRMNQMKEQLDNMPALGGETFTEPDNPENSAAFFQMIYYLILRTVHFHHCDNEDAKE